MYVLDIPEHLPGFWAIDSEAMPSNVMTLEKFGEQEIKNLACFYGSSSLISHGKKICQTYCKCHQFRGSI